jgi:glutamyl-tRNA synthetase
VTPAIITARLATEEELVERREWYLRLLDLLRVRSRTIDDIVRQAGPYFLEDIEYDPTAVAKNWKDPAEAADLLRATRLALASAAIWETGPLETALRELAEARGVSAGKVFQPLRVALTGLTVSPGIFEMLIQMGRELSLKRIDKALLVLGG